MSRLTGTVVLLLGLIVVLPAVAEGAQAATPGLLGLLLLLVVARLLWPTRH